MTKYSESMVITLSAHPILSYLIENKFSFLKYNLSMCGILGSIGQFKNINEESFNPSFVKLISRGPDFQTLITLLPCNNKYSWA